MLKSKFDIDDLKERFTSVEDDFTSSYSVSISKYEFKIIIQYIRYLEKRIYGLENKFKKR